MLSSGAKSDALARTSSVLQFLKRVAFSPGMTGRVMRPSARYRRTKNSFIAIAPSDRAFVAAEPENSMSCEEPSSQNVRSHQEIADRANTPGRDAHQQRASRG